MAAHRELWYKGLQRRALLTRKLGLELDRKPPAVYKGIYDPRVLYRAFEALHDIGN